MQQWDEEHIFYNPLIKLENGKTLIMTKHYENKGIYKLGQLFEEKANENRKLPYDKVSTKMYSKIRCKKGRHNNRHKFKFYKIYRNNTKTTIRRNYC